MYILYVERLELFSLDAPIKSHAGTKLQGGGYLETLEAWALIMLSAKYFSL